MKVAVLAHQNKTLGGGLDELRRVITDHGVDDLQWMEVPKSKKAPKQARKLLEDRPDLVFVWGGDGMVQRCVDTLAGSDIPIAIVPAGTANLLASNLNVPIDLHEAVKIGFSGRRRQLDLGVLNGERFAVMAGTGFDALMIKAADGALKDRLGRFAYVWTGLRNVRSSTTSVTINLDGTKWFSGRASCVLIGNIGTITGGIEAFDDARPDDGWLDVGVVTAEGAVDWARTLGRVATGRSDRSRFVRMTRAREIDVKLDKALPYELDGGDRPPAKRLKARVEPAAIAICVPEDSGHREDNP